MKRIVFDGKEPALLASIDFEKVIRSVFRFFKSKDMDLRPYPTIIFDCSKPASFPDVKSGYYIPKLKRIRIFVKQRMAQDTLFILFHELVHHWQNIGGRIVYSVNTNTYKGKKRLEREAQYKSHSMFSEWCMKNRNRDFHRKATHV